MELACKKVDENLKNWLSYGYLTNILHSAQEIIPAQKYTPSGQNLIFLHKVFANTLFLLMILIS